MDEGIGSAEVPQCPGAQEAPFVPGAPLVPSAPAVASARQSVIRQPGFGWGLAAGMFAVIVLAIGAASLAGLVALRLAADGFTPAPQEITLNPVAAGEDWFTVAADGTGTLEGWSGGSFGSGDDEGLSGMPDYYFDIAEVGAVADVPIRHVVSVGADKDTEYFIGKERYSPKDRNGSVTEYIFGEEEDDYVESPFIDGEMRLIVEFRREGDWLVATKVTADPNAETMPELFLWW